MAYIETFEEGDTGLAVRSKINAVSDLIVNTQDADYTQTINDDVVIVTALTADIKMSLVDISTALKALTVFNLSTSTKKVNVVPMAPDTIDRATSLLLHPGESIVLTPDLDNKNWVSQASPNSALSSLCIYVRSLGDLAPYYETESDNTYTIPAGRAVRFLEDIEIPEGDVFVCQAGVTMSGLSAGSITLSGSSSSDFIVCEGDFQMQSLSVSQAGTGGMLKQSDASSSNSSVVNLVDVRLSNGDISLVSGQLFRLSSSVMAGNGTLRSTDPGVSNIVINDGSRIVPSVSGQRCIEFDSTAVVDRVTFDTAEIVLSDPDVPTEITGMTGIYVHYGAKIGLLDYINGNLGPINPGTTAIVMENPNDVGLGVIEGNAFNFGESGGYLYGCLPPVAHTYSKTEYTPQGMDWDGKNLFMAFFASGLIQQYSGLTGTAGPQVRTEGQIELPTGCCWYQGNLVVSGENKLVRYSGFTSQVLDQSPAIIPDDGYICDVTTDGTYLYVSSPKADVTPGDKKIHIYDGAIFGADSAAAVEISALDFTSSEVNPWGLGYDGYNLWITTGVGKSVYCMDGVSTRIKYRGPSPEDAEVWGVLPTQDALILNSYKELQVYVTTNYAGSGTFDHTSPTWRVSDNTALSGSLSIPESSDRGGSIFTTSENAVSLVDNNAWQDIADKTTQIKYSPFRQREKCQLAAPGSDLASGGDATGKVIWTGARKRAVKLSGALTFQISADELTAFSLGLFINDVLQEDSIGIEVFKDSGAIKTARTMPIARDLVANDAVQLRLRRTSGTGVPQVYACKLSIT